MKKSIHVAILLIGIMSTNIIGMNKTGPDNKVKRHIYDCPEESEKNQQDESDDDQDESDDDDTDDLFNPDDPEKATDVHSDLGNTCETSHLDKKIVWKNEGKDHLIETEEESTPEYLPNKTGYYRKNNQLYYVWTTGERSKLLPNAISLTKEHTVNDLDNPSRNSNTESDQAIGQKSPWYNAPICRVSGFVVVVALAVFVAHKIYKTLATDSDKSQAPSEERVS